MPLSAVSGGGLASSALGAGCAVAAGSTHSVGKLSTLASSHSGRA